MFGEEGVEMSVKDFAFCFFPLFPRLFFQTMSRGTLVLPSEGAREFLDAIGSTVQVQFVDVSVCTPPVRQALNPSVIPACVRTRPPRRADEISLFDSSVHTPES